MKKPEVRVPKDDSSAQTPTAAASFRTVFDALKAALGWVGTNEDALRDLITLVTDLPASVEANEKENPAFSRGDASMRRFISSGKFTHTYADTVLPYFDPFDLVLRVDDLSGAPRDGLLKTLRGIDPALTEGTLGDWVGGYISSVFEEASNRSDAAVLAQRGLEESRRKIAHARLRGPLSVESAGFCPQEGCGHPLILERDGQPVENFDVVTIDPAIDQTTASNLIALCHDCALAYGDAPDADKIAEMRQVKDRLIKSTRSRVVRSNIKLFEEISDVLERIETADDTQIGQPLVGPYLVHQKLPTPKDRLLAIRIRRDVADFYVMIDKLLKDANKTAPDRFEGINTSVSSAYVQLQKIHASSERVYGDLVAWLQQQTSGSHEACALVISYFVQECAVFRVPTK